MQRLFLCVFMVAVLASCDKAEESSVYRHWMVTKVESAGTGSIAQPVEVRVTWPYSSGCDVVDRFETSGGPATFTIKATGYTRGGVCTMDAGLKVANYNFSATKAGTYTLNFENPDGSVITHVITVN